MPKQIKYSDDFIQNAVLTYLKSDMSAAQIARILGVHSNTLCRWIRQYKDDTVVNPHTTAESDSLFKQIHQNDKTNLDLFSKHISEIDKHLHMIQQIIRQYRL